MARRKKGFDPLSSLFEAPSGAELLPDVDDEGTGNSLPPVDMTDPLFRAPPELAQPPRDLKPMATETLVPDVDPDPIPMAAGDASPAVMPAPPAPAVPAPVVPPPASDPAELARAIGRAAAAKAQAAAQEQAAAAAAAPAPAPAQPARGAQDPAELARAIGRAAAAKAAAEAPPPAQDPAELARAIGRAAAAKASAAAPAASGAPSKSARAQSSRSRVESLASRAVRPTSALDAARAAARQEEERRAQAIRTAKSALSDQVQVLIPQWLPGVGTVYVANAMVTDQRDVLTALWKGHRAKFLADGHLERGVGAAAVIHALNSATEGSLVAAHVVTDASDYLVWLDMSSQSLVAAFPDARSYFAGGQ